MPEDLDVDKEFEKFTSLLSEWDFEFAKDDYLRLIKKVCEYTDGILCEANYTDDILIGQWEAEPELEEVAV